MNKTSVVLLLLLINTAGFAQEIELLEDLPPDLARRV